MDRSPDLGFFCLVARKASLTTAARELGLTPSAASKRLAQLERRLGVQLFNRTTRRLTLTNQGELYYERASRILSDIDELERLVTGSRSAPRGLLRINATFTFGRTHVAPAASDFVKRYPEVEVQLQLTDRPLNLSEEGYDLGIRFGEPPDARVSARRIAHNRRLLCAAPAYLARAGTPRAPSDLARHSCIMIRQDESAYGTMRLTSGRKTETVKVRGGFSTNDPEVALAWALDGHGIVVRSEWEAGKYLRAGRLREVLPHYSLPPADLRCLPSATPAIPDDSLVRRFSGCALDQPTARMSWSSRICIARRLEPKAGLADSIVLDLPFGGWQWLPVRSNSEIQRHAGSSIAVSGEDEYTHGGDGPASPSYGYENVACPTPTSCGKQNSFGAPRLGPVLPRAKTRRAALAFPSTSSVDAYSRLLHELRKLRQLGL